MNTVVEQSSKPASTDKMLELNMLRSWEDKIKEKIKAMWKAGYSYVIICEFATNALGIQRASEAMKAIAKVQSILDKVNGDLNDLKKLLEELQGLGFGKSLWYYKDKNGNWVNAGSYGFQPGKENPGHKLPPGATAWATPKQQMECLIKAWLAKSNDLGIKGPDGKTLNNEQAMRYIWKELYGPKCDNKGGLIKQLQTALNNPWYQQTDNGAAKTLKALNSNSMFGSDKGDWTGSDGDTFLDFLKGQKPMSYAQMADMFGQAFTNSWYKNNNVTPPDKNIESKDDVGNMTSGMDSVVQSGTAMNSTESADLSMFAQQLTSLINIVQQMLQQNDKSNTTMVNNQQAR